MAQTQIGVEEAGKFIFRVSGICSVCGGEAEFKAERESEIQPRWYKGWFRGSLKCLRCGSIPRERALFDAINLLYPDWRGLDIHESSPTYRGASKKLQDECAGYVKTQYDPIIGFGNTNPTRRYRSENLEKQTFGDALFDLVITQDVFEHLFAPDQAIKEIARTLRPGGAHIMTVPIMNGATPSVRRASMKNGEVQHLLPPQYHGNLMSSDGSLVTIDWGYDIIDYLAHHSGLSVSLLYIDDISRGLSADYNDVIVCKKVRPLTL